MKPRPKFIGKKVDLLGLYNNVSVEEMEEARDQALKHFETTAGEFAREEMAEIAPVRRASRLRWIAVSAAAAVIMAAILVPTRVVRSAPAVLEDGNGTRKIHYGEIVRSGDDMNAMLSMTGGARVEVRSMSELSLERADDGVRIRLNNGGVIVDAAAQRNASLYVETKDVMASVGGAVSLVNAEEQGSRVAAIGGEIHVQQGTTAKKLQPGEQVRSNPNMLWIPVTQEVAWSREAVAHVAMLAQVSPTLAFEEATIRPANPRPAPSVGARGGGETAAVDCLHRGQLDRRRLFLGNISLYELAGIVYAYCADDFAKFDPIVLTGSAWIKSERWDIEALIPEGVVDPLPTGFNGPVDELWNGRSPKVQKMLETLLVERFKIVARREMKEMPAYVLTVAPGGPQFQKKAPGTAVFISLDGKPVKTDDGAAADRVHLAARCDGNPCSRASFWNMPLTAAVTMVSGLMGRPVLDRTGIREKVSFALEWPRDPSISGLDLIYFTPDRRDLARAFETIGLKFEEDPKAKVEMFVIERAEKPSNN